MLVYCGRRDDEVKLRGHRVNLSEIAAKIMSSTMVQDALVCPVDGGGGVQLCAYLIRKRNYDPDRLKEYLQTQLPPYEVPVFYVALEQFPLTDNGKIDKTKLPEPRTGESETTAVASPFIEVLMAAMSSVIPDRTLTPEDNFYAIGGDSIKAIQISSRLQEKGYELTVRDILLNPVIRSMSTFIKARGEQKYEQGIYEGEIKKTPIISRFFEQHFTEEGYYNQSVLLKFKKVVSVKVLNRAFRDLIRHHDGLRINYDGHTGQLFYNNRHLSCQSVVKSKYSLSLRPEILNKMINKKLDCRFNLKKNLLIRPYYITNNKDMGYLYIIAHHLVIDGVSWRILLEDLASLLEHTGRQDFKLPDKTASYADYAEACSRYAENLRPADSYWGEICGETKGSIPTVVSDRTYRQQKSIHFHLDKVYTRMLVREANKKYDTKPEELLLIALSFALEEMYGLQEVPLDVERHGRNFLGDVNVNRTVGWFTTVFPVRLRMSAPGYSEKVKSIREQLRKTEGRGYEYGIFKYVKKQLEDRQTRICFNYLGEYVQQSNPFFTLTRVLFDNAVSPKNKLESCFRIEAYILEQCLNIYIFYADDLAKIYLPHSFSSCYKRHITDLLEHCVDS